MVVEKERKIAGSSKIVGIKKEKKRGRKGKKNGRKLRNGLQNERVQNLLTLLARIKGRGGARMRGEVKERAGT